jgi:hypothetical protein
MRWPCREGIFYFLQIIFTRGPFFQAFVFSTMADLLDLHILGDLSCLDRVPGLEDNEAEIFSPGK